MFRFGQDIIAPFVKSNTIIADLDLSGSTFGDEGAEAYGPL